MVGWKASAKTAVDREHPWVAPTLVVKGCMVWLLSVQIDLVERVYQVCVSL